MCMSLCVHARWHVSPRPGLTCASTGIRFREALAGPLPAPSTRLTHRPRPCHTYPEMTFSRRALGHVHPAPLCPQLLVERLVQREAVDQVTAHVQAVGLPRHLHGDVLPLGVSQAHVLQGNDVLGTICPVGKVQRVCWAIGDDFKLPLGSAGALQSQERAPGLGVLLQAGREEEPLLLPHDFGDFAEVICVHWWDVVKADEAIGRHTGVWPPELLGPNGLPVDVADAEKVEGHVLVLGTGCSGDRAE